MITLDRAPVNALNVEMHDDLTQAFESALPTEVVVLHSAARHFCAGQDLTEYFGASGAQSFEDSFRASTRSILAALRCKAPIVTAVHGASVGAGTLLACSSDVLISADDTWFSLPEVEVGTSVGGAVAHRMFGGPITRRMLLAGEKVHTRTLAAAGMVTSTSRPLLFKEAIRVAKHIASLDSGVVQLARDSDASREREFIAQSYEQEIENFLAYRSSL